MAASKIQLYEKLLSTNPEIKRKGDANPYTAVNGNMFTLLHQSQVLAIRLPAAEREQFLKKYKTTLFEAYGAVMKEYVRVPDGLLSKTAELRKYLEISYEYAKTLKPKPTTKKKR
jgi:TfoX/Sxy family transcriptional regulator of competence genes